MKHKHLGRTGISVSELCFGTMSFGGDADEATSEKLFNRCREAGVATDGDDDPRAPATDLDKLHEAVKREFLNLDEQEKTVRSVLAKMESEFIRRLMEFQHE